LRIKIVLDRRTIYSDLCYRLSGEKWTLVLVVQRCYCGKWSNSQKRLTIQSCLSTELCPKSRCRTFGTRRITENTPCKCFECPSTTDPIILMTHTPLRCNEGEFSAWYLLSDSNFDIALALLLQCLKNVSDWASRNDQVNVPHKCVVISRRSSAIEYWQNESQNGKR